MTRRNFLKKIGLVIFGILLSLGTIELCLWAGGGVFYFLQQRDDNFVRSKTSCLVLCIGESTSAGKYPLFLEQSLNQNSAKIKFKVIGRGSPGATTDRIISLLDEEIRQYDPDVVVAMLGLNDKCLQSYRGRGAVPEAVRSLRTYKLLNSIWSSLAVQMNSRRRETSTGISKISRVRAAGNFEAEAVIERGKKYLDRQECVQAEEYFRKALALDSQNERAFLLLAEAYDCQGRLEMAKQAVNKAIGINPDNKWAYSQLAGYYEQEKSDQAELYYKKALAISLDNDWLYTNLAWFYRSRGNFRAAEAALKEARVVYPDSYWINAALESLYREAGYAELAAKFGDKLKETDNFFPLLTRKNYRKLKEILDKKNIKLVCVQYPLWKLEPLREIFTGQRGITFVDNEKIFQEALKHGNYKDYFLDMYGGNFGHCTEKGERLLADNIARAILEDLFPEDNSR